MNPLRRLTNQLTQRRNAASGRGLFGPDAVQAHSRHLEVGAGVCRTLAVTGYPREVSQGWLAPLLEQPGRVDVSVHVEPVPTAVAADRLRRQVARLEATRRLDTAKGRLPDPEADVAAGDAHDLAANLARGESKLFRVGLYLTIHAPNLDTLEAECARVRALLASMLLDTAPATFRTLQGWTTTLPVGVDALGLVRTMDTPAVAAAFPFTGSQLNTTGGILYGTTTVGSGLVTWDRFAQDNHNSVILARSGAGKSYLAKLEILRSLYTGIEIAVVDPEDEYARLADAVGGTYLHLGTPQVRLNPFDLPIGPDALTRRALFIHTLISVLLGRPIDAASTAVLDRAVLGAYHAAGITSDARTHARPAPVLADLVRELDADDDPAGAALAGELAPFTTGSHRGLLDGPTTTQPVGHLTVFSLRDVPDELKPVATLITLDAIWRRVTNPTDRRRHLVIVDEGWQLMSDPAGARFLFRMAKSARKHWAGLTVATQDTADLLGSDLGRAVVTNAATQILMRQAPQAIDAVGDAFGLSAGERQHLLATPSGGALLVAGTQRVAFQVIASPDEHTLATTNPAELVDFDEEPDL